MVKLSATLFAVGIKQSPQGIVAVYCLAPASAASPHPPTSSLYFPAYSAGSKTDLKQG